MKKSGCVFNCLVVMLIAAVITCLAAAGAVSLWWFKSVRGDGVVKTESRSIPAFSGISATGGYRIQWSPGEPSLTLATDQNLLEHIRTQVKDGMLSIDSRDNLIPTHGITVAVSGPSPASLTLTGGHTFTATGLAGEKLAVACTGASTVTLGGAVDELTATLTGACKLAAGNLHTKVTRIVGTGACTAEVTATDFLKVSVTGASSVTYGGRPRSVEKTVTGACTIQARP